MRTIEQLESLLQKNQKQRALLQDQLESLKTKKLLPSLKKTFEGKWFKYNNGYDRNNRWWVYSYCHKVINEHRAILDVFEHTPTDGWNFKYREEYGLFMCQEEISEKEYENEAIHLVSAAKGIMELKEPPQPL